MFYRVLNSRKLKIQRAFISGLLIISYMTTFSSCMTTEMTNVPPESIQSKSQKEITKIELKNGNKIDCRNKLVKFENKPDSADIFIISTPDTLRSGNVHWTEQRIPAEDVLKVHLEKTKVDGLKTALWVTGIAAVGFVLYLIAASVAFKDAKFN